MSYGKYHSSVLSTYYGLGDAYQRIDDREKAHQCFKDAIDVANKVPAKQDDMFELMVNMKLAQTDDCKVNKDSIFTKLEEVRKMVESHPKLPVAEKKQLYMQINNSKKNICYSRGEKRESV